MCISRPDKSNKASYLTSKKRNARVTGETVNVLLVLTVCALAGACSCGTGCRFAITITKLTRQRLGKPLASRYYYLTPEDKRIGGSEAKRRCRADRSLPYYLPCNMLCQSRPFRLILYPVSPQKSPFTLPPNSPPCPPQGANLN